MATKIRLARRGAKKNPFYWIVVADSRSPRDGRFIEKIGTYNPMVPKDHTDRLKLVDDRVKHWLSVGAKPTDRVERFLGENGFMAKPGIPQNTKKSLPKKKAQERAQEKEEKLKLAEEAAKEAAEAAKAAAVEAAEAEKAAAEAPAPAPEAKAEEKPAEAPTPEAKAEEEKK